MHGDERADYGDLMAGLPAACSEWAANYGEGN